MKKILISFALLLTVCISSFGLVACKKTTSIYGTWTLKDVLIEYEGEIGGITAEEASNQQKENMAEVEISVKFLKDGSGELITIYTDGSQENDVVKFDSFEKVDGEYIVKAGDQTFYFYISGKNLYMDLFKSMAVDVDEYPENAKFCYVFKK